MVRLALPPPLAPTPLPPVAATTTFCAAAFAGGCTTALTILTSCVTESEKGITIDNEAAYFFQFVHARLNSTGR